MYTLNYAVDQFDEIELVVFDSFNELMGFIITEFDDEEDGVLWMGLDSHDKDDSNESICLSEKIANIVFFIEKLNEVHGVKDFHIFGFPNYEEACGYIVDLKNGISKFGWTSSPELN